MSDTTNPLCTFDPECGQPAIASYVWPWGESGMCCARHQVVIGQRAKQLKRSVQLTALQPGAEQPVTRSERIQAQATRMALEAELGDAQERGMELYRSVESLQSHVKMLMAQKVELEAQLQEARRQNTEYQTLCGELRRKAANENAELLQLRALVKPAPPARPAKG